MGIRRELLSYDRVAASAQVTAPPVPAPERGSFVRQVALEQTAFALCVAALAWCLHRAGKRATRSQDRSSITRLGGAAVPGRALGDIDELQHANRLATIGRLTAGMAHEFGTPLGVVLARAQMIVSDEGSADDMRADARAIVQEVSRMTRMCREVLDYARPKASVRVPTDLVQIARHMLTLLLPDARKRNVQLSLSGEPQPTLVLGDASKLTQIFTNLIINALQAMPRGGPVVLSVERVDIPPPEQPDGPKRRYACVRVEDHGTGIRSADLPHIFETFFTTKQEGEGTGLGLSVSARLAREHGGWIGVTTEEGQGSCFSVYIPLLESAG